MNGPDVNGPDVNGITENGSDASGTALAGQAALPQPRLTRRGVGWAALFWVLYAVLYSLFVVQSTPSAPFIFVLISQLMASLILGLYSLPVWWLTVRRMYEAPVLAVVAAHLVLGPLYAWASLESYLAVMQLTAPPSIMEELNSVYGWIYFGNLTVYAVQFAVFHLIASTRRLHAQQQHAAELRALARERELTALKAQINPHFLFNTLNSISAVVRDDPEQARTMIVKLSDLLRRAFDASASDLVPLRTELQFTRTYLDLESERFSDRLTVTYDIALTDDDLDTPVPAMVLQPLVENAIKHGIAPSPAGGTVTLRAVPHDDRVRVTVADDGAGPAASLTPGDASGYGIGLANTRRRLEHTFGPDATLHTEAPEPGGFRVWFSVPRALASAPASST